MQHYKERLKAMLGPVSYPIAREILSATAAFGRLEHDAVKRYHSHFLAQAAERKDTASSFQYVMHVLEHDGYLERHSGVWMFVSGMLEDWWRGCHAQYSEPVVDLKMRRPKENRRQ